MSKAKDAARRQAEAEVARRRQSAAHRSMRARAARGKGARSVDAGPATPAADHTPTSELAAPTWLAADPHLAAAEEPDATSPARAEVDDDTRAVARVTVMGAGTVAARGGEDDSAPAQPSPDAEAEPDVEPEPVVEPEPDVEPASTSGWTVVDATVAGAAAVPADDDATAVMEPVPAQAPAASAWPGNVDDVRTEAMLSSSTPTGERGAHAKKRGRGWLAVPIVIVVLAGLYVGAQALLSGTVPRDTETLGVAIGGQSTGAAIASITDAADTLEAQDVALSIEDESVGMPAGEAGLGIDAEATISDLTGFTLRPERLWQHIAGAGHIDPVPTVDEDVLDAAVADAAQSLNRDAADATVEIVGTAGVASPGHSAIKVDTAATADLVADAWPASTAITAVGEVTPATISDQAAEDFADDLSTQLLAGDVTLSGDTGEATVTADDVAAHATVSSDGGELALVVDGEAIAAELVKADPELETEASDAEVAFTKSHDIKVTKQVDGTTVDGAALGEAITAAAATPQRAGELPLTVKEPEVTDEDLGVADLKEKVASFDTPLTNEPIRTQNLRTAAADVAGTVLLPDDVFDLYKTLSPITTDEGYADAHVIVDGVLTEGIGGGLSQMATTTYNAAYFSGYEISRFRPHSVWFDRYPAGRESTLYGDQINVEFTNNTPYAAVLNSYISGGRLHVDVWSTPYFEVTTKASAKSNIKKPGVKKVDSPNCEAHGPGEPGFTITNTRTISLDGEVVSTEPFTWTYAPNDAVECVSGDD